MKAYWLYTCDFGHVWTFFRDEDSTVNPHDQVCQFGHEAVTLSKQRLLDMVQVAIRPAAQIVDRVTQQIGNEYEYYLVVTDLHNNVERMSRRTYWWDQIKGLLDRFRVRADKPGMVTPARAWEIMDSLDGEATQDKTAST